MVTRDLVSGQRAESLIQLRLRRLAYHALFSGARSPFVQTVCFRKLKGIIPYIAKGQGDDMSTSEKHSGDKQKLGGQTRPVNEAVRKRGLVRTDRATPGRHVHSGRFECLWSEDRGRNIEMKRASSRTRTEDRPLTKRLLYRLS